MKSRILFLLTILVGSASVSAQNLVPNGGFEDVLQCPSATSNLTEDCADWYGSIQLLDEEAIEPTPDWYHACGVEMMTPPNVALGYQNPMNGDGVAAIIPYSVIIPDFGEVIGVGLNTNLEIGSIYNVTFSLVSDSNSINKIAINRLGFKFTTYPAFNSVEEAINNYAHGTIDEIINDTLEWQTFTFSFQADSAYSYFHLGRFYVDEQLDTLHFGAASVFYSYYFIDNVSVVESPLHVLDSDRVKSYLYPNPASSIFKITTHSNKVVKLVRVLSITGKVVQEVTQSDGLYDVSNLPKGFYLIEILFEGNTSQIIKLIKQ